MKISRNWQLNKGACLGHHIQYPSICQYQSNVTIIATAIILAKASNFS